MSIAQLLPLPPSPTADAQSCVSSDRSFEGRALSPDVVVPGACGGGPTLGAFCEVPNVLTPTTPASGDSARGFGTGPERGFDLSAHLYGGASARLPW